MVMERAKLVAKELKNIYNITGQIKLELDWNDNDEYVYRYTFTIHTMGAALKCEVELQSLDVDFDKTLQKLVREAIAQVQSQLTFLLV